MTAEQHHITRAIELCLELADTIAVFDSPVYSPRCQAIARLALKCTAEVRDRLQDLRAQPEINAL